MFRATLPRRKDSMHHMKHIKYVFVTFVALLAVLVGSVNLVHANSPVLVSGTSPFATCTIGGPGTNYVNAEVEPRVAVNPKDPSNIVGVFQQDRWSNGGAHGLVAGVSHDGGATWAETWAALQALAREAPPPTVATTTAPLTPGSRLLPTAMFTRSACRLVRTSLPRLFW